MSARPRVYVDSSVLLFYVRGAKDETTKSAIDALASDSVDFIYSPIVMLETLPSPSRNPRYAYQVTMLQEFFASAECVPCNGPAQAKALECASRGNGLGPGDALHVGAAIIAGADYLLTGEKPGKQLLQCKDIEIRTVYVPKPAKGFIAALMERTMKWFKCIWKCMKSGGR